MSEDCTNDDLAAVPSADAVAARLLDEAGDANDLPNLTSAERRRVADLQWLHSLLVQVLRRDDGARERRIAAACAAIRAESGQQTQLAGPAVQRRPRWLVPTLVAASLLVAAVLLRGPLNPPQSAIAAVQSSLKEATASPDRLYRIDTRWQPVLGGDTQDLVGDLWVRGNSHYLLRQNSPLGELYVGGNGEEHWLVPPVGPVLVGRKRLEDALANRPIATPFLQVTSLLERLTNRYELTLAAEEDLPAAEDTGKIRCTHVVGRKLDQEDQFAPDVIELWAARQSGIAYRIKAVWKGTHAGPREMLVNLMPLTAPLPTDWYDHAAHHVPDRRVIQHSPMNEGV